MSLMDTWIFLAAGGVFLISIFAYVCLMVFVPEWVGITGKVALQNEASHRADSAESHELNQAEGLTPVPPAATNDTKKS